MREDTEIYLDKIKLGAVIVEKELSLIELYNTLIADIRLRPDIEKFLKDYPVYPMCWQCLAELYDFLENDYLSKLKSKSESSKIKECIRKYRYLKELRLDELRECVDIIRKIMSISKFHDVIRKDGSGLRGLEKISSRYKLKE